MPVVCVSNTAMVILAMLLNVSNSYLAAVVCGGIIESYIVFIFQKKQTIGHVTLSFVFWMWVGISLF